jgi:hypothetical protein
LVRAAAIVSWPIDRFRRARERGCERAETDVLDAELHLFDTVLRASEDKAVEKLKQLLACVFDTIVVEAGITSSPTTSCPGFLLRSPKRANLPPARYGSAD